MTEQHHPGPAQDPAAEGGREIFRYTSYTVFTRTGAPGAADGAIADRDGLAAELDRVLAEIAGIDVTVRGIYDASGFRPEDDLLVWMHAERPESLQHALRILERSPAAEGLVRAWAAVGVHRQAEFSRSHAPAFMSESATPREWITVYPFTRSYEWYLLPEEERRRMLREHGMLGRDFPQVHANTVASFALGDWEWLLSFEAEELHDLVDMMRHLRYSDARLHVRDELPFHVGRRLATTGDVAEILL
ncbi:hydrogen peroxide-dependent heme synthase [Brachybacterium sp. AOP25-B2-12]|uniref:hydrogen peroxide-dependent heme synthase n=1 Tax=Brachybacterium sp. AOP25-B2-12 TaxID=3457710 RepID=UPI004033E388